MFEAYSKQFAFLTIVLISVFIGYSLRALDKNPKSRINFEDLLLDEKGKLSGRSCTLMGAFVMSTWLIIYLALRDRITPDYFLYYMGAWVTPTVAKFIFHKGDAPPARRGDPKDTQGD